jgi:hypothetical protein
MAQNVKAKSCSDVEEFDDRFANGAFVRVALVCRSVGRKAERPGEKDGEDERFTSYHKY